MQKDVRKVDCQGLRMITGRLLATDLTHCTLQQYYCQGQSADQMMCSDRLWGCSRLNSWLQGWGHLCDKHNCSHPGIERCMFLWQVQVQTEAHAGNSGTCLRKSQGLNRQAICCLGDVRRAM